MSRGKHVHLLQTSDGLGLHEGLWVLLDQATATQQRPADHDHTAVGAWEGGKEGKKTVSKEGSKEGRLYKR